jgi:hypothetical protein
LGLPGGKVIESTFGGDKALAELIDRLNTENFNGYIRTTTMDDENPNEGFLVFKNGEAQVGVYFGENEIRGERALRRIIADSLSSDCLIDIGSYAFSSSSIRVDHIIKRYPDGEIALDELNLDDEIRLIREEETRRRKTMLEEEKKKRSLNVELATKEDELFTSKRSLDQEIEMRRESERALKRLQEEIDTIKQGSMALIKHFTTKDGGNLTERDALQIAEQKIEEIKLGREWESLNNEKALLQERESEVTKIEERKPSVLRAKKRKSRLKYQSM